MMNIAQINQFLKENPKTVLVDVDTCDDKTLILRLISYENSHWPPANEITFARIRDGKIAYKRPAAKAFSPRLFFTREYYQKNGVEFVTKKARKIVSSFLGGKDLFETVIAMEAVVSKKYQEAKERRLSRLENAMQAYFADPVVDMESVRKQAREVAPRYMVVKDHVGWCSFCGNENHVSVMSGKRMTCPSCGKTVKTVYPKNVKHDRDGNACRYDSFWLMASDLRKSPEASVVTSYFLCSNKVDLVNNTVQLTCREEARKIERKGKPDDYWCDYGSADKVKWHKTVVPHFQQYGMGGYYYGDRSMWCERGYVIPDQHIRFLRNAIPLIKKLPIERFYVDNIADTWSLNFSHIRSSLDRGGISACKKLTANGMEELACRIMFSTSGEISSTLNLSSRTMSGILKLTDCQYQDFLATDRSYASLKTIKKSNCKHFAVPPLDKYREIVRKAIPKKGLDAGTSFLIPVRNTGYITFYKFVVRVLPGGQLRESLLYCDGNPEGAPAPALYKQYGDGFYAIGSYGYAYGEDVSNCVLLREDFDSFADKDFWKELRIDRIPEELLRRNSARIKFMTDYSGKKQPSEYLPLYERFAKAGFSKLLNGVSKLICEGHMPGWTCYDQSNSNYAVRKYAEAVFERAVKGDKLYKVFDIPRNIMKNMKRSSASWSTMAALREFASVYPIATWEDFQLFSNISNGRSHGTFKVVDLNVNNQPYRRTFNYLISNKIHAHEYVDYLDVLTRMRIPLVADNVFPKDFQTTYVKMSKAYSMAKDSLNKEAMIRIRDALMSDKKVRKYLKANTKYLVFVPESPEELVLESKRLNNCLATYIDKVAQGNTSVFFIRDADNPNAALYAMEVRDGKMIQLHGINNCCLVQSDPAAVFARGFVSVLKNINFNPKEILQAA